MMLPRKSRVKMSLGCSVANDGPKRFINMRSGAMATLICPALAAVIPARKSMRPAQHMSNLIWSRLSWGLTSVEVGAEAAMVFSVRGIVVHPDERQKRPPPNRRRDWYPRQSYRFPDLRGSGDSS